MPNLSELTDYNPQDQVTPQGRLYVSPSIPTSDDGDYFTKPVAPMPELPADNVVERIIKKLAETEFSPGTDIGNKLTGSGGQERYQLWPEKIVRSALTAIPDAYSGKIPMNDVDPETGELVPSQAMIGRALDMASFAGVGGIGGTGEGGAVLGAGPSLRPALKYKDRLYKGKEGQEHQDVIPPHLYPEFQKMAMSGEDISHYNFGFVNDKGHFLNREDALKYGIDSGLIDPQAGKFGALTSTLMADSSKPGTAIEAMAKTYPLAKPTDRWTNTLGQNDHLIQNMSPDQFLEQSRPLKIDAESRETIDALKQHMREGKQLDPLELHANGKEDGRHRAIAAKELGISQVPVINYRPPAQPFYSALEHNVNAVSQNKMNGEAWLGTLANKPGVKPEELDWTGLRSFLEENKGKPVTKEQVQEHLASNKVELKEVNKGTGDLKKAAEELQAAAGGPTLVKGQKLYPDEIEQGLWDGSLTPKDLPTNLQPHAEKLMSLRYQQEQPTKYHSYQLPGGENYREMLMTLPEKINADTYNIVDKSGKVLRTTSDKTEADALAGIMPGTEVKSIAKYDTNAYKSSHWDEPNILAHVRMNDRTIDGKKSLHLEEIQSDWHQQGRDKGYAKGSMSDADKKEMMNLAELGSKRTPEQETSYNQFRNREYGKETGVPDAPFKKTWHELALKRMLREAAEKGYDRLSWTPGEAQAARYDLSKSVNLLSAMGPDKNGKYLVYIEGKDKQPLFRNRDGFSDHGQKTMDVSQLEATMGKEPAKKLMEGAAKNKNNEKTNGFFDLKDDNLKIGGEGMKGFYDQIIPKALEKIGKEHGVKVKSHMLETNPKGWHITPPSETVSGKWMVKSNDYNSKGYHFDTKAEAEANLAQNIAGERAAQPVHYIDIPQSLKDRAMQKGFPLFSGGYVYTPVNGDPFKDKK